MGSSGRRGLDGEEGRASLDRRGPGPRAAAVCLLAVLFPGLARSQPLLPGPDLLQLPKDRIPLYFVVHQFFSAMATYREARPLEYESRLWELGIEPGGEAGAAVGRAIDAAAAVLARPTTDRSLEGSEERFMAFQQRAIGEQCRGLAEVYGDLLAELEAAGADPDRLRDYVDQTIRDKVSLSVQTPPGGDPAEELLADPNVRAVLPFEELAEAFYRDGTTHISAKGE